MFTRTHNINYHTKSVTALKYSSDGCLLASASADQTCGICDVNNGKNVATLNGRHTEGLNDVEWLSNRYIATASDDKNIIVWDIEKGAAISTLSGHQNFVTSLSSHPSQSLLLSGSEDETIRVWDIRSTGSCVCTVPAHSEPVTSVQFHPSGWDMLSSSYDGLLRVWDARNGACRRTIQHENQTPIAHATYSPNGRYILTNALDSTLRLIRPLAGESGPKEGPRGTYRCAVGRTSEMKRFTGHVSTRFASPSLFIPGSNGTLDENDREGQIASIEDSQEPQSKKKQKGRSNLGDRDLVVSGSEDGGIYMWDLNTQKVEAVLEEHQGHILALDYNPAQKMLASGGGGQDFSFNIWAHYS
mmetsp:Transcript_16766/g.25191  ORF Transcript_16766/g.25191 Transcript_16766/m.25191 type:complete len:358 (-) Transcript_16766:113-1186(-)